jgi:hypothetical protein
MIKVNMKKAALLKQLGWSYEDIAKELKCSYAWCAKYLRGIDKDNLKMKSAYISYIEQRYVFDHENHYEETERSFYGN